MHLVENIIKTKLNRPVKVTGKTLESEPTLLVATQVYVPSSKNFAQTIPVPLAKSAEPFSKDICMGGVPSAEHHTMCSGTVRTNGIPIVIVGLSAARSKMPIMM